MKILTRSVQATVYPSFGDPPWFPRELPAEAARDFDALSRVFGSPKGTVLFREFDACRRVFFVCSGEVKLWSISSKGKTHILKIARSGDWLGLGTAIGAGFHDFTAELLTPALLRSIRRDDLLHLLGLYPEVGMHAARVLAEECKSALMDARNLACLSAAERLAQVLINWGRTPLAPGAQLRFDMNLTRDELGSLAGLSRETATRLLARFQQDKLIEIHGSSFLILDPSRLGLACA